MKNIRLLWKSDKYKMEIYSIYQKEYWLVGTDTPPFMIKRSKNPKEIRLKYNERVNEINEIRSTK